MKQKKGEEIVQNLEFWWALPQTKAGECKRDGEEEGKEGVER